MTDAAVVRRLKVLHAELDGCKDCSKMIGPVVHGGPIASKVILVGQAPGPREGSFGKPFAWTAGRTLFRWFEESMGISEPRFRERIYMAAVARCFPGQAPGGGDRKPDPKEIESCKRFLRKEVEILEPDLVIAVGTLAIYEVLGDAAKTAKGPPGKKKLDELIGKVERTVWHGRELDVIALPHPSGASPWHKMEPGKTLLAKALKKIEKHAAMREVLG
jgi:uracil-DNA glycosylase